MFYEDGYDNLPNSKRGSDLRSLYRRRFANIGQRVNDYIYDLLINHSYMLNYYYLKCCHEFNIIQIVWYEIHIYFDEFIVVSPRTCGNCCVRYQECYSDTYYRVEKHTEVMTIEREGVLGIISDSARCWCECRYTLFKVRSVSPLHRLMDTPDTVIEMWDGGKGCI